MYRAFGLGHFCRFTVKGNSCYVINYLSARGVKIYRLRTTKKYVSFSVPGVDKKKAEALMEKTGREFKCDGESGATPFFKAGIKRFGFILGGIVVIAALILYSMTLFSVRVNGNINVSDEKIINSTPYYKKLPMICGSIDINSLEKEILKIDGISSVDVKKKGGFLEINVLEEIPKAGIVDKKAGEPVVSAYDAEITRVVCLDGTARVKKGDGVKKGDILIAPYLDVGEGLNAETTASGRVYGLVTFQKNCVVPLKTTEYVRTNVTAEKYETEWCGRIITRAESPFNYYDVSETQFYIEAAVPFKITKKTYFEKKAVEVPFDFDKYQDALIKEGFLQLLKELPDESKIIKSWYSIKRLDKETCLDVYYQTELLLN